MRENEDPSGEDKLVAPAEMDKEAGFSEPHQVSSPDTRTWLDLYRELSASQVQVEALREALKPFVAYWGVAKKFRDTPRTGGVFGAAGFGEAREITAEDFERAVALLAEKEAPSE